MYGFKESRHGYLRNAPKDIMERFEYKKDDSLDDFRFTFFPNRFNDMIGLWDNAGNLKDLQEMDGKVDQALRGQDVRGRRGIQITDNYANKWKALTSHRYSPFDVHGQGNELEEKLLAQRNKVIGERADAGYIEISDPDNKGKYIKVFTDRWVLDEVTGFQRAPTEADIRALRQRILATRRACKFGIEHVVNLFKQLKNCKDGGQIHYVLEGVNHEHAALNINTADENTTNNAFPITYSELRYIFRHWEECQAVTVFHNLQVVCRAPWDNETPSISGPWKQYGAYREKKIDDLVTAVTRALDTYNNNTTRTQRIFHTSSAQSDKARIELRRLLDQKPVDYVKLRETVRWALGIAPKTEGAEEQKLRQLKPDSRFAGNLRDEYLKWFEKYPPGRETRNLPISEAEDIVKNYRIDDKYFSA
jgi:hypothetical protein